MFETPILLIVFNRSETTRQILEVIRRIQPRHLFIAADGPRADHPDDIERCSATRSVAEQMINWPCELHLLFRDKNRGCGRGPAEAITWFFEHVEVGIILEDDCLPDLSFFPYCQELLATYRYNEQIFMITGTNALQKWGTNRGTYFFSYLAHSLGWASWRRAWQAFDYEMHEWQTEAGKKKVQNTLLNSKYYSHYEHEFTKYQSTKPDDVWDFQWLFARWINGGKTIVPSVNLISNIGFNAEATHSFYENDLLANLPVFTLQFPLTTPNQSINKFFDWYLFERFINQKKRTIFKKILLKFIKITYKSTT